MSRGLVNNMLTMNNLGDGSTLSLDFTTGVLDPRLTFTRSTTATYINSSGYVTSAAINAPRFDYSPTNIGEPRGLLIEGTSTNPILYSQDFSQATWSKSNATVTAPTTAPDGTTTAYLLTSTTAGGIISQTHAATGNATSTYSIYVKQGTAAYCDLYIYDAVAGATRLNVRFTFATKVFTVTTGSNAVYQELTNGWFRISATCTALSTTNNIISYLYVGFAVAGTTYYGWGAQLEAGSGASSYIPTGASQVTRTVDTCYMSGISSWYNESAGTVISNITYNGLATDNSGIELSVGTGSSATNRIGIRKGYVDYYSGGVNSAEMYPTVTSGNVRIGTAYSLNDFAMCSNGGTMRTDGSGAVPVGLNTLKLYADNGTSGLVINGLIKSIKYYPTRLSNAQLQALTAP
jgi:hypothetical protein